MGKFTYLPEIIGMVLIEYIIMVLILTKLARNYCPVIKHRRWLIFEIRSFDSCATSVHGENYNAALCFTRFVSFSFFLGVGVIYKFSMPSHTDDWQFFTNWNLFLISAYFFEAFLASTLLIIAKRRNYDVWIPDHVQKTLGTLISIHFAVAGASAIFITTVNFAILDSNFEMINVVSHLATSVLLLLDLFLNNIHVHYLEFIFNFTWALVWMTFIWPLVVTHVKNWPYEFMETDRAKCFMWYNGMFVVNFFFYNVWWALCRFKLKIFGNSPVDGSHIKFRSIVDDDSYSSSWRFESYDYLSLDNGGTKA
jgi:hypothetical protein